MDQLINLVSQKAGISEDQARTAAQTVVGFLKDRLPGPLGGQIENALGNSGQKSQTEKLGSKIPGL